jgi:iron complex transport system permease protein
MLAPPDALGTHAHGRGSRTATTAGFAARVRRARVALFALGLALGAAVLGAALAGAMAVPLGDVGAWLLAAVGLGEGAGGSVDALLDIRLPRVLATVAVGASLGLAGAAMQGLFRNPLVDPGLLGVSSGARLGAVLFLVLGGGELVAVAPSLRLFALPIAAFVGALASVALVWRIASRRGRAATATLILAGVALALVEESATGLLSWAADEEALRLVTLWRMGSFAGVDAAMVGIATVVTALGAFILWRRADVLDALSLGEAEAHQLGYDVPREMRIIVAITALAVGVAVATAGVIAFVGLVAPHLVRLALGPAHRPLLLGSALLGAFLVVVADTAARTLVSPAELPIGAMMAVLGGPLFLTLVARRAGKLEAT